MTERNFVAVRSANAPTAATPSATDWRLGLRILALFFVVATFLVPLLWAS
jgi:hypothetical protein